MAKNILFIMCDQLRADYLPCYGHPYMKTPNIDRIVRRGVSFTHAYCQAPLCGPSRASFYTGRYMASHGALANDDPLKIGELSLGDYLKPLGYRNVLVGKSEARSNNKAMDHLQINQNSETGINLANGGFENYEHFAGIYPNQIVPEKLGYNEYLKSKGYSGNNPWEDWANSALDENQNKVSGWQMRHAHLPALIPDEDSETAFTTDRALEFLKNEGDKAPWCLHLSYIKPHWPYLVPAPYHDIYNEDHVLPANKHEQELESPHSVFQAFHEQQYSQNFSKEEVRKRVIPTYMGLIQQVDDHLGRVLDYLESSDLMKSSLIIFTSDHGDYLGDHWLGEKDLFHEPSVRIPMIVSDPDKKADQSRNTSNHDFVEAIDLLPTFIEFVGGKKNNQRMEGQSLLPYLRSNNLLKKTRDFTISQIDFSDRGPRESLNLHPYDCRAHMIRNKEWKFIIHEKFDSQLFDLTNDPNELQDLGNDAGYKHARDGMQEQLFTWFRNRLIRTEMEHDQLFKMGVELDEALGIKIGHW